jgi:1,4-alpha-glucan branching enzyme
MTGGATSTQTGEMALVLHTHMPYVEGYGTWPFGEEWLWEAMACVYLPLLKLLESGAPLTVSLSPVLADQLAAEGVAERFDRFLGVVRAGTHQRDVAAFGAIGEQAIADEIARAAGDYESARERFALCDGALLGGLARYASWTSAATHAVLPLCATDAGVGLQVANGIASHRARSGHWNGGFWLPECAYAPWLEPLLSQAGVRACCVDLTDHLGLGAKAHLQPLRSPFGPVLVPIDRETIELVWSDDGYPAHACYRDYHRLSKQGNRPWANDGTTYDPVVARGQAHADARDFVGRAHERLKAGGLLVCALDTELLGHWWYEGMEWLTAVVDEAREQGLRIAPLDDALTRHAPRAIEFGALPTGSWGTPRDLSSWDCPATADIVRGTRDGELRLVASSSVSVRAVRELLALQSSDWAFMISKRRAGAYGHARFEAHRRALADALSGEGEGVSPRNLAVLASADAALAP